MKNNIFFIVCLLLSLSLFQKVSGQFTNLTFDKAYGLGKGKFELAPVFTNYYIDQPPNKKAIELGAAGLRFGMGITDNFDLKVRYERAFAYNDNGGGFNVFAIEPKISFFKNIASFRMPLQITTYEGWGGGTESIFTTTPQLLFTYVNPSKTFDLTGGVRSDIIWEEYIAEKDWKAFAGFSVGMGFSSNLDKWSIRPELSMITDFDGTLYQIGVAACFKLASKKEKG